MPRRNTLLIIAVLAMFILAALVVFPIDEGVLGQKGVRLGLDLQGGVHIVYKADLSSAAGAEKGALEGAAAILENRVNPLGVTEPLIQIQGEDRIVVELPGVSISDKEKERLARVDILEFGEQVTDNETVRWTNELGNWKPAVAIINGEEKELTSRYFKANTQMGRSTTRGGVELHFEWTEEGSKLSEQITGRLIGKPLAIFDGDDALRGENNRPIAPTVQSTIIDRGVITGLSLRDATQLSQQLNFGRLPVSLKIVYDQTVSPILGTHFVSLSLKAGLIGVVIVMLFMIVYYRLSGVTASLGLIYYAVLLLAIFKLFNVTLTLAGIGGFILSVGMAIDANVLIFERIKEELWVGRTLGAAIEAGFKRAWTAIWDSNITTILAGGILFWLGSTVAASAPVKGFALTLIIGVAASMFTAVTVTRTFLRPFVGTGLAQKTWLFAPYQKREKKNA